MKTPQARALLIDITRCIGCRACVDACKESTSFPGDDTETELSATAYTVLLDKGDDRYVRKLCMHCVEPSCASVCPVGALHEDGGGPGDLRRRAGASAAATAWWPARSASPATSGASAVPAVRKCDLCVARLEQGLPRPASRPARPRPRWRARARSCSPKLTAASRENPGSYYPDVYGETRGGRHIGAVPVPGPLRGAGLQGGPRHRAACPT